MENKQKATGQYSQNLGYTEGALQLRLATQMLIENIEMYLAGYKMNYIQDVETGEIRSNKIELGTERVNKKGLQDLMGYVQAIINPSVVQGNFTPEMYNEYIYDCRVELTEMIFNNIDVYEIDERNFKAIVDFILKLIEPFISRLIDNKERESYAQTIKTSETATHEQKKGLLPF